MKIMGIDPGLTGAIVTLYPGGVSIDKMPIRTTGKDKEIDYDGLLSLLENIEPDHIFLEKAFPMAMGSKHAFNYGRGFAAIEIAIVTTKFPVTYVLPKEWTKIMHEGINADLKPKAKSIIAVKRLCPDLLADLPMNKKGALNDGPIDALLIARYGARQLGVSL